MNTEKDLRLSNILTDWYKINKRDLPWRNTTDPYKIWLSEVILQQTRVDQGFAYFQRFVQQYPTICDLAAASEDDILKLWQGLGYYSRARNLHGAAKQVSEEYGGKFPSQYNEILSLRGIGEYTAAAIISFAYNKPYAVVDGNVYRVLSRIFAIDTPIDSTSGQKEFALLAQELINDKQAALHNQAIMEFGALQCTPASPKCNDCPASDICLAYSRNKVSKYPFKQGKTKVRHRYFNYFDIRLGNAMYLNKRTAKDIWQNLYELPLIETEDSIDITSLSSSSSFISLFENSEIEKIERVCEFKHVLSHQIIHAVFYKVYINNLINGDYININSEQVEDYAIPQLIHKYLSL